MADWLAKHHPDIQFHAPLLTPYPMETRATLLDWLASVEGPVGVVGSSLGGFWSSVVVDNHPSAKAVLVNPAVKPHTRFPEFVGKPLKGYYDEREFMLEPQHMRELEACIPTRLAYERYWVMLQEGDETLDYRMAEQFYAGCKILTEPNGNHSFEGFERYLPDIIEFLFGLS